MQHLGTAILETQRLILRPFRVEDAEAMYLNWAGDAEVTKYLRWPAHESTKISQYVMEDWVSHYDEPDYYQWAITIRNIGDEPIGSISVIDKNDRIGMAHIGYCIGRKWWNKGIASEALEAVIGYFFTEVGMNRIESIHDPRNPNSGKVMQKCGMNYEGTMREADWNNQGICDASMYAILKKEYCV